MGLEVRGHSETCLNPFPCTVSLRFVEGLAEHYVKNGTGFTFPNYSKAYKYPTAADT